MGEDKALRAATSDLGYQLSDLIEAHRFEPELGRAWAALLLSGDQSTLAQLAELLDEDEAEAARLCQELTELGAAHQTADGFRAEPDPLRVAAQFMRARQLPLVEETEEALLHARDKLRKSSAPHAAEAARRLEELARHTGLINTLLKALARGERLELDRILSALGKR